jgi:hypothetical protein
MHADKRVQVALADDRFAHGDEFLAGKEMRL